MQAWQKFLDKQEQLLGKETVDKWLRSLKVVHFDSANLYCEASDSFQVMWFEEHIRPVLKGHFFNNNHRPIKVHLTLSEEGLKPSSLKGGGNRKEKPFSPLPLVLTPDRLDPTATFETFVAGKNNAVLFRFFCELIEGKISRGAFNPIYLHGKTGTGKTHLLMALAQAFAHKGISALYAKAETFTEHVVNAIRSSEMQTFRNSYRKKEILLVDDVHIFSRKVATQEEFFHTFNTLQTSGRQIILTAHCPPPLLEEIEPRLISRFEWGIVLHLEKLDTQELKQVLLSRCHALQFPLEDEVADFLIETFPSHPKALHQALETLILRTHLQQNRTSCPLPLNRALAKEMLQKLIEAEKENTLTPDKVIAMVAAFYGIRSEDILGKSHAQEHALPRQVAMYICRTQLHLPFLKMGRIFSRDHSTVMASVKQIQSRIDDPKDQALNLALEIIKRNFP